ncbi:MAG TPA: hypothetical protein DCG80_02810 [Idiomarina sp.]|nr:hypothetical protein [Idiomarina sp.]
MLNLYEADSAYVSLQAHFKVICDCLEEEKNDFDGVTIALDNQSFVKIECFGLNLRIEPFLGIDDECNPTQQLLVTRQSLSQPKELEIVAKLIITERCVAKLEDDDETATFDFGKVRGYSFRKLPIVNDFLATVISSALKDRC